MAEAREAIVEVRGLSTSYGEKVVLDQIDLTVYRGETFAIVGASGSGKSTLMREMVMLQQPDSGSIRVLGREVVGLEDAAAYDLRCRIGVLFQTGALFGGLTVLENVAAPLREHTKLRQELIEEIATVKLALLGLTPDTAALYPSQLSGGMRKRVALARAIALDPELLFLDEPTSGLDPVRADDLDQLVLQLKAALGLTVVMVTHDMDSLWRCADRVVLIGRCRVLGMGTMEELSHSSEPGVREFFQGPRGRAARTQV